MTIHSSKQQWTSLHHGRTIRNELAHLLKGLQRLAEFLGLRGRWTIEGGFLPFAIVSGCIIFLLGLSLPIGIAAGILYTSIVMMALWSPQRYAALWVAGGGTVLLVLGFAFSTDDRSTAHVMIDRTFTLMTLWIVAVVSHLHNQHDWSHDDFMHNLTDGFEHRGSFQDVLLVCISCKKARDKRDRWHGVGTYLQAHSEAAPYSVLCPDCQRMWPAARLPG